MPYVSDRRDYVRYGCGGNNCCHSGHCLVRAPRMRQGLNNQTLGKRQQSPVTFVARDRVSVARSVQMHVAERNQFSSCTRGTDMASEASEQMMALLHELS